MTLTKKLILKFYKVKNFRRNFTKIFHVSVTVEQQLKLDNKLNICPL